MTILTETAGAVARIQFARPERKNHGAAEKLLLGEALSAEEALDMELINRILPPTEMLDHARPQCERLSQLPPESVRETKRLMKAAWCSAIGTAIAEELRVLRRLIDRPYAREAFTAVICDN